MTERQTELRIELTTALVGDRKRLYHESVSFKHSIDALAAMLPLWVDGIAAQAAEDDANLRKAVELAQGGRFEGGGVDWNDELNDEYWRRTDPS